MKFVIRKIVNAFSQQNTMELTTPAKNAAVKRLESKKGTTVADLVAYANEHPERTCWEVVWDVIGRSNLSSEDTVRLGDVVRRKRNNLRAEPC